jgi:ABC-type sugar transport system ATPase subunit
MQSVALTQPRVAGKACLPDTACAVPLMPLKIWSEFKNSAVLRGRNDEDRRQPPPDPPTLEVVEKLGSEILLDVAVGRNTMVASVDPGIRVNVRDRLRLALSPERLHFFDAASEAVI